MITRCALPSLCALQVTLQGYRTSQSGSSCQEVKFKSFPLSVHLAQAFQSIMDWLSEVLTHDAFASLIDRLSLDSPRSAHELLSGILNCLPPEAPASVRLMLGNQLEALLLPAASASVARQVAAAAAAAPPRAPAADGTVEVPAGVILPASRRGIGARVRSAAAAAAAASPRLRPLPHIQWQPHLRDRPPPAPPSWSTLIRAAFICFLCATTFCATTLVMMVPIALMLSVLPFFLVPVALAGSAAATVTFWFYSARLAIGVMSTSLKHLVAWAHRQLPWPASHVVAWLYHTHSEDAPGAPQHAQQQAQHGLQLPQHAQQQELVPVQ